MQEQYTKEVQILISCPDQILEEKNALQNEVNELNKNLRTYLADKKVQISTLTYEENIYSVINGRDAQLNASEQFGDEYDIIVVMFWSDIGTKTPRYRSGTVEELEKAMARYRESGKPRILLYFKMTDIKISLGDKIIDSIYEVNKIYRKYRRKEGITREFNSIEQLCEFFSTDINAWIMAQDFKPKPEQPTPNF